MGFPWPFYGQCYGPPIPGGGLVVDPARLEPFGLAFDIVFWYLLSAGLVYILRRTMHR